jgi:CRISPR/Cas system CSM-associated protein Csm2 small subunit
MIQQTVDVIQGKQIKSVITIVIALGSLTVFLAYLEERKHRRIKRELLELDRSIKELQLTKLQNGKE